jgi:hypothetical protein
MAPEHVDKMTHNLAFLGSLAPKRCPSRTAIPVENPLENDVCLKKGFCFFWTSIYAGIINNNVLIVRTTDCAAKLV